MLETIRKYWIGFLVLALVFLHASIVGIIRYQASLAKQDISCEVLLGEFVAFRTKDDPPVAMTLHAMVPHKHRMKSRQLIELNETQVRQALEEHLRQFDSRHLVDPYMTDLRSQLLDILTQLLGSTAVEDVLVTQIRPLETIRAGLEFVGNPDRPAPRRLVATLRGEEEQDREQEVDEAEGEHVTEEGSGGHAEPSHDKGSHDKGSHDKGSHDKGPQNKGNGHGSGKPESKPHASKKPSPGGSHGSSSAKH